MVIWLQICLTSVETYLGRLSIFTAKVEAEGGNSERKERRTTTRTFQKYKSARRTFTSSKIKVITTTRIIATATTRVQTTGKLKELPLQESARIRKDCKIENSGYDKIGD